MPALAIAVACSELCRRFMAITGVGQVTALSFTMAIDDLSLT